jgi:hypothetical protein
MALKASEISQLIKERIENFEATTEARDVGTSSPAIPSAWH